MKVNFVYWKTEISDTILTKDSYLQREKALMVFFFERYAQAGLGFYNPVCHTVLPSAVPHLTKCICSMRYFFGAAYKN